MGKDAHMSGIAFASIEGESSTKFLGSLRSRRIACHIVLVWSGCILCDEAHIRTACNSLLLHRQWRCTQYIRYYYTQSPMCPSTLSARNFYKVPFLGLFRDTARKPPLCTLRIQKWPPLFHIDRSSIPCPAFSCHIHECIGDVHSRPGHTIDSVGGVPLLQLG